jgi:hypothetical protein
MIVLFKSLSQEDGCSKEMFHQAFFQVFLMSLHLRSPPSTSPTDNSIANADELELTPQF